MRGTHIISLPHGACEYKEESFDMETKTLLQNEIIITDDGMVANEWGKS